MTLGALLEASRAEKKYLKRPLAALEKFPREVSAKKKSLESLLGALKEISRQKTPQHKSATVNPGENPDRLCPLKTPFRGKPLKILKPFG